jgi:hypothetical protein
MPGISASEVRKHLQVETVGDVCAHFFGLDALTPQQRLDKETAWGYKSKCVRLLQNLCSVSERGVKAWGKGLEFADIPPIRLAQLTIFMLRSKLEKTEAEVRERDEQIKKMSRVIESLRWQLQEARRSA